MVQERRAAIQFSTIIARNYLAYARVLARSLASWHPETRLTCCVIDDRERRLGPTVDDDAGLGFDIVHLQDLVREPRELERMAMCYDVMELATAVKPWVLRHLLDRGAPVAVHLDPDIACFARLDDAGALARAHGIVLTPHTTEPVPRDGCKPTERDLMETGTYNLGFIAVSQAAIPFLDWWQVRLRRDAIVDPMAMLFTDQRWVDLAPGYFSVHVWRDPGCNLAYWNLGTRRLEPAGPGFLVNGRPLRFLHFSGYDPDRPHLLSRHQGDRPRVLLSERPILRSLCDDYRRRLLVAGWGDPDLPAYGYGRVPGGPVIDRLMRRCYRRALLDSEAEGRPEPPNPFRADEAARFLGWLMEPVGGPGSRLTRYLDFLYHDRIDLQVAFNEVPGPGAEGFIGWAREHGVSEEDLPVELVPPPLGGEREDPDLDPRRLRPLPRSPGRAAVDAVATWREFAPPARRAARRRRPPTDVGGGASGPDRPPEDPPAPGREAAPGAGPQAAGSLGVARRPLGVNVAGYLEAELGLGTAARAVLQAIERSGAAVSTLVYRDTQSRQTRPFAPVVEGEAPYDCTLVCINGDLIGNFARDAGADVFQDRYTIAQWHWETDTFPESMRVGLGWVDEVWVASGYEQRAIQRETSKPVLVFPMPVVHDAEVVPLSLPRDALGLPQGFCFLFCFDYLSVMERKNPVGLVEAFTRAFPPGGGVHLVIKSINGERRPNERERLRLAAQAHPDVHLMEGYLTGSEVQALTAACDAYVSLHRAEGFGLTLADAMAVGRPVIATRYSGNLEFMTDDTGYLVDFTLVPVGAAGAPYPPTHRWADPDLDHAADLMRQVVADPDGARARAARGQQRLRERFSTAACAQFVAERLAAIRALREPAPAPSWALERQLDQDPPPGAEIADAAGDAELAPQDAGAAVPPAAEPEESSEPELVGGPEPEPLPEAPAGDPHPVAEPEPEPAADPDLVAAPAPPPGAEPTPPGAEPEAGAEPELGADPELTGEPDRVAAEPEPVGERDPTPVPPLPVTDAAVQLVEAAGTGGGRTGARGWAGGVVRRAVDRLLLPHERRQREVALALVAAIREVAGTVPAATDLVHRRVDGAEARRARLGDRVEGLTDHVDRLTRHVQELDGIQGGLRLHVEGLGEHVGALTDHVQALDGHLQGLDGHVRGLDDHLRGLDDRVGGVATGLTRMTDHLDRLTRHVQGLTELVDRLNGRSDELDGRQGRILIRHDRLASRVDRLDDLVTHLERVERELLRARRAAERLVAEVELRRLGPGPALLPDPAVGRPPESDGDHS